MLSLMMAPTAGRWRMRATTMAPVRVAVVVVSVVVMMVTVVGVIATPGVTRLSGAAAASRGRTVLVLAPHNTLVLRCSIPAMRFEVFSHVGRPQGAAAHPSIGSRRGLSGSRWLPFSMTEQPARDADSGRKHKDSTQKARPNQSVPNHQTAVAKNAKESNCNFSCPRPRIARALNLASQPCVSRPVDGLCRRRSDAFNGLGESEPPLSNALIDMPK